MQTASDMTKDMMFKLRLDTADRTRLDRVAAYYGLNAAGAIRFLLKREDDRIDTKLAMTAHASSGTLDVNRLMLLEKLEKRERAERAEQEPATVEGWLGQQYPDGHAWLRRSLNTLRREGYIKKTATSGYVLTTVGRYALANIRASAKARDTLGPEDLE